MADFKALSLEERLTRLNNHLLSLKEMAGRLEDNFKTAEFDFSYSLLKKNAEQLGLKVDGKNYIAHGLLSVEDSEQEVVKMEQDAVNTQQEVVKTEQDAVNTQQVFVKQEQQVIEAEDVYLTVEELLFVKQLFKERENLVKAKQTLFLPQFAGAKKTTGISVYIELWERWGDFKKAYPMYSGTDLMALALEEFMEKYDETL